MVSDRTLRIVFRSDRLVALLGDPTRAALTVLVAGAIGLWLAYYAALGRLMYTTLHMNDFGKFYYSAQLFLDGRDMYGPSPATEMPVSDKETRQFWNMNPPHFHILLLPLARLSPIGALAIWVAMNFAALAISVALITRELQISWTPTRVLWATFAAIACSATGAVLITGQMTFLLMLGVTIAWRDARQGRWERSGAWLGVIASVKPFLGIFFIYLLPTRWRAALAMFVAGTLPFLIGLATFGVGPHVAWVKVLSSVQWEWALMNASIAGFLSRSLSENPFFPPAFDLPELVSPLTLATSLAVAALSFLALRRWNVAADHATSQTGADRSFATLLLAASLVSPIGWVYYLWLLAGPIVALREKLLPSHRGVAFVVLTVAGVGYFLPLPLILSWREYRWAGPTIGSVYFWLIMSIWVAVVYSGRRAAPLDGFARTGALQRTSEHRAP